MVIYVETISDLKSNSTFPIGADKLVVIVGGYYMVGDGGGGSFAYYTGSIPIDWHDDGGLIIASSVSGWYKRLVHEPYLSVKWFGAYGNDIEDDIDAIRRTFEASKVPVYVSLAVTNVDLGNYDSSQASASLGVVDGTRTRIYFPAGIYRISDTIAFSNLDPYDGHFLEIVGERSVIKPYDEHYDPGHWAIDLEAAWHMIISKISISGFNKGLNLYCHNSIDAGTVRIDNVHFSDIADVSVQLDCVSAYVEFNACNWRWVKTALLQLACDRCVINGGWLSPLAFTEHYQSPFLQDHGSLHIYNVICVEAAANEYSNTASWVKLTGRPTTLLLDSMRFGSENGSIGLVNSWVIGNNWNESWRIALGINIRNCNCPTYGSNGTAVPVRLFEVPNFVVFEDNKGFTGRQPIIWIDERLDLTPWRGLFSIKLDNIAYAYHKIEFNQYNNLYNTDSVSQEERPFQMALLPFVRINNGLVSYGYLEDYEGQPKPLIFFQGFTSFDLTDQYGAISGDYSYEVKLCNIFDGTNTGEEFQYGFFRIETKFNSLTGKCYVANIIDVGGNTTIGAPTLTLDGTNPDLVMVSALTDEVDPPYEIYYEITCLIPPVVRPVNGIA